MVSEIIKAAKAAYTGDPWPLLGEVAKLWIQSAAPSLKDSLSAAGLAEQALSPDEQARADFMAELKKRVFGLLLIIGRRGTGKTALSLRLVEFLGKKKNYAIGIDEDKLPPHIHELNPEDVDSINDCCVVVDDAGLFYGSDSSRSANTKILQKILDICRHKDIVLIVNIQRAASLSKQLCDPDIVFLKPPSLMYMRSEDENLRKFMKPAEQAFGQLLEEEGKEAWKNHTYVMSDSFCGMIQYELPSGWSQELTKNKA